METSDLEQVCKAIRGDREAYGRLVDAYQGMAFAVALNLTGNYNDSLDVIQDAFIQAYRKLSQLSDPSRFGSWLYTITRRVALRCLQERHKIPVAADGDALLEQVLSDAETPAEAHARKELGQILWAEVGELPPRTREAILLHYMEGFSIARAAEFLGISEAAVKVRLSYGREKLREGVLGKLEEEIQAHKPTRKTRTAILAALPPGGTSLPLPAPGTQVTGPQGAEIPSAMEFLGRSLKVAGWILAAGISATLLVLMLWPRPGAGPVPPIPSREEKLAADAGRPPGDPEAGPRDGALARIEPATHSIAGRVMERLSRRPVAGVKVRVLRDSQLLEERTAGVGGEFRFEGLRAGSYGLRLGAEDPALRERYFLPSDLLETSVRLKDGNIEGLEFFLSPATSLSGVVLDPDRRAVEGAKLTLSHFRYKPYDSTTASDAEGRFSFTGLFPARHYEIACEATGFHRAVETGLEASLGRPLEDLVILLFPGEGAEISGHVLDAERQPVENVLVRLVSGLQARDSITGPQGRFEFRKVPAGRAILHLDLYDRNALITVKPNEVVKDLEFIVDLERQPGYVSGTLLDTDGKPISRGTLHAQPSDRRGDPSLPLHRRYSPGNDVAVSAPDARGRFRLAYLSPGTQVDILYQGPSGPRQPTDAKDVPVPSDGLTVTFQESEEKPPRIAVRGAVLDGATLRPIPRFAVSIESSQEFPVNPPRSIWDREGKFEILDATYLPGRTFVYAEAEGYAGKTQEVLLQDGKAEEAEVEVHLTQGGAISGRVVDGSGDGVEGAKVFLVGEEEKYVLSDAGGLFSIANARKRSRRELHASHPEYAPFVSAPFEMGAGTTIEGYVVTLTRGGALAGVVRDEHQAPIPNVPVWVGKSGETIAAARTSELGEYGADRLPPGECTVEVEHAGIDRARVTIEEGRTVRLDFVARAREGDGAREASKQGKIAGIVQLPGGTPASEVPVALFARPRTLGQRPEAATVTKERGEFSFKSLPAGAYEIQAGSETSGEAAATVDLEAGKSLEGIHITLPQAGRLIVRAYNGETGESLIVSGILILMDSEERCLLRGLGGTPGEGDGGAGIPAAGPGAYRVGGLFEDSEDKAFFAPFQGPVSVIPGGEVSVRLSVYLQVKVQVSVVDRAGKPATDFRVEAWHASGLRVPVVESGEGRFEAFASRGPLRVILKRAAEPIHDGIIQVDPGPLETAQEARITVE